MEKVGWDMACRRVCIQALQIVQWSGRWPNGAILHGNAVKLNLALLSLISTRLARVGDASVARSHTLPHGFNSAATIIVLYRIGPAHSATYLLLSTAASASAIAVRNRSF